MLKIKDNIDLKELEKFGFKEQKEDFINDNFGGEVVGVDKFNKGIYIQAENICSIAEDSFGLLYDLIQAGLVEKVKEN